MKFPRFSNLRMMCVSILACSSLVVSVQYAHSFEYELTLYPVIEQTPENGILNSGHQRKPSVPYFCIIADSNGVSCGLEEILSFEIWDADNTACIYQTDNEDVFIEYLRCLTFPVTIKFVTFERTWQGYLNL